MQRSLRIFEESIKSDQTRDYYKRYLESFFKFTKESDYDSLVRKDPKAMQEVVEDYVMFLKKRCAQSDLNPNSVPVMLAPVFMFFEQNDVIINSKKIKRMYPERVKPKGNKPYIREEIKKMLVAADERSRALIHFLASTGVRPGILDDPVLIREHITDMGNDIWCFKVYAGSRQEDYVFTTPEATRAIEEYFSFREFHGEKLEPSSPVFRNPFARTEAWNNIEPLRSHAAALVIFRILRKIGKRKSGQNKRHHYDQAVFYGFRKRFDTILNKTGVNPSFKEKLMLHKQTLDGKYYFTPTKEELLAEFSKAILELTIDDSERNTVKIEELLQQKSILESKTAEIPKMKKQIEHDHLIVQVFAKTMKKFGINFEYPDGTPYEIDENLKIPEEYLPEHEKQDETLV